MSASAESRPRLILLTARYAWSQKNAVAATLAWVAEQGGALFEVYYDSLRAGRHYGGGEAASLTGSEGEGLGLFTGGLVTGARHLEALGVALQRFETTVVCVGHVAFSNTLAALANDCGARVLSADEEDVAGLYAAVFTAFDEPWPETGVLVNAAPSAWLEGIDAYVWPEIFHRRALGVESMASPRQLRAIFERGVRRVLTCGISPEQHASLAAAGFELEDLGLLDREDDHASATARVARRWSEQRRGWILGDPVLASYWLPTACRERRAVIFGRPQSRAVELLDKDIGADAGPPVLGRQDEDSDFFTLSRLGQSFQLVDPGRPPLPVLLSRPPGWSSSIPEPDAEDPGDDQLLAWAEEGRVLVSLVFWTGMIRETENLYPITDLIAMTGLRGGLVLTAQSLAWRPSPLDLLMVPRDQGGVYPHLEVLLGSCGTGAAIEYLLEPDQLAAHLREAHRELERAGFPRSWWPQGWWATMDARLVPRSGWRSPKPVRWNPAAPYRLEFRFDPHHAAHSQRDGGAAAQAGRLDDGPTRLLPPVRERLQDELRGRLRDSRLKGLFSEYRPYEKYAPGPVSPDLVEAIRRAGFSYMLTKSGFGSPPHVVHRHEDFVALNYTAGQWDGWTPFETVNDLRDLRRAERRLLARRRPGWLLGTLDTCLWAFSGELWRRAPQLVDIARFAASGGTSGRMVNVAPRVVARYSRLIDRRTQADQPG